MFEKTTGPISHFLVSFEPYCPSSGYRLKKLSNFWSRIDLGHILKNRVLAWVDVFSKKKKVASLKSYRGSKAISDGVGGGNFKS